MSQLFFQKQQRQPQPQPLKAKIGQIIQIIGASLLINGFLFNTAHAVQVLSTIKPLQFLVSDLILPTDKSELLLSPQVSPHDYSMRPSDLKKIKSADLIIWVGPVMEHVFSNVFSDKKNLLTLQNITGLPLMHYGEGEGDGDDHGHDHEHGHGHSEDSNINGHIWLSPEMAPMLAQAITAKLIELNPALTTEYQQRLSDFNQKLAQGLVELKTQLQPIQHKNYFVYHDAYRYFEDYFKLSNQGYFTVDPTRRPGAKTLAGLKDKIDKNQISCIFSETQFNPAIVQKIQQETPNVHFGSLDPLGRALKLGTDNYLRFLFSIAGQYEQCLK